MEVLKKTKKMLLKHLKEDEFVMVTFTKKDGSERTMKASLHPKTIASYEFKSVQSQNSLNEEDSDEITVWDLENNGWRSFNYESIVKMEFTH